jgi:hypothetical protein
MKEWFVAQAVRNREIAAAVGVTQFGFEAYVPMMPVKRRRGRKLVEESAPRFGLYIFVRFDPDTDDWGVLTRREGHHTGIARLLKNAGGEPQPVPDAVIDAIRAFTAADAAPQTGPMTYRPGQRVICTKAGVRMSAVFVGYCGNRQMIRMWLFGAERVSEVTEAELEPADEGDCGLGSASPPAAA